MTSAVVQRRGENSKNFAFSHFLQYKFLVKRRHSQSDFYRAKLIYYLALNITENKRDIKNAHFYPPF